MFDSLSDKLGGVLDRLRGKARLSEEDVDSAVREIRVALLEADVALPVVKDFIETIRARAVGADLIRSVTPAQQIVKIVHDGLVELLGAQTEDLNTGAAPAVFLMVGLQGSGKTTSTAKIARFLTDTRRKKVLMASLDVNRPAAQEQLRQLGEQTDIATLPIVASEKPLVIAARALESARRGGFDVVILDTAGRLSIDETLMQEARAVREATNPVEVLLVADAMTGQDAVQTARIFDEKVGLTGIMLTRTDGDARGGAALSMRAVTGKPIKLVGTGEKWDALEPFHPERIAGRILGMGDVVSLVEKATATMDMEDAEKMAARFKKGKFDFNDLLSQMRQMRNMGGMTAMLRMMPGIGKIAGQLENAGVDDSMIRRQEAIIFSMTLAERAKPEIMNASRKRRIAAGSGTSVQEINRLIKQQEQMQLVLKRMNKMGKGKMMAMMREMIGGAETDMLLNSTDPDTLAKSMSQAGGDGGLLGHNPFGAEPSLPMNPFGGGLGNMLDMGAPVRGGTKKNRKKKKR